MQELGIYGRLRKIERCGPVLMFRKLLVEWRQRYSPSTIAQRVQAFFRCADVFDLCSIYRLAVTFSMADAIVSC